MLTVTLRGSRERPLSWIDLAVAWFDRTRAVVPVDYVYPAGQTDQQNDDDQRPTPPARNGICLNHGCCEAAEYGVSKVCSVSSGAAAVQTVAARHAA